MKTSACRPSEADFYDVVVHVIGKMTGYEPYIGVPARNVQTEAIRLLGIDPKKPPWPLEDSSPGSGDGLFGMINRAWYKQTRHASDGLRAFCGRPPKQEHDTWALTVQGVERAKQLRTATLERSSPYREASPPTQEERFRNKTAAYLAENFPAIFKRAREHLSHRMPRSAQLCKIDDHVMNWIERVIRRDGLCSRLETESRIPPSHICGWMLRSAYTDLRYEGGEPVCRLSGSRTKKELQKRDETTWTERMSLRGSTPQEQFLAQLSQEEILNALVDEESLEETFAGREAFHLLVDRLADLVYRDASFNIPWNRLARRVLSTYERKRLVTFLVPWRSLLPVFGTHLSRSYDRENLGSSVADWLIERREIDEVFADDPTLARIIRTHAKKLSSTNNAAKAIPPDPAWHREILIDRFLNGMTLNEIASKRGIQDAPNRRRLSKTINRAKEVALDACQSGAFDDFLIQ